MFLKGKYTTRNYNEQDNIIHMKEWVGVTLFNNGDATAVVNGQRIEPDQSFNIGPANVKMDGEIILKFESNNVSDVRSVVTNFVVLDKTEC